MAPCKLWSLHIKIFQIHRAQETRVERKQTGWAESSEVFLCRQIHLEKLRLAFSEGEVLECWVYS